MQCDSMCTADVHVGISLRLVLGTTSKGKQVLKDQVTMQSFPL